MTGVIQPSRTLRVTRTSGVQKIQTATAVGAAADRAHRFKGFYTLQLLQHNKIKQDIGLRDRCVEWCVHFGVVVLL